MSELIRTDGQREGSPGVALLVWTTSWALALGSVALVVAFDLPRRPLPVFLSPAPPEIRDSAALVDVAVALVYAPVSALILWRRPHPVGVLLAVLSVGSGLAAFGLQYGLVGEKFDSLPLHGLIAFTGGWAFVPGTFVMAILPLLVRRDRLPTAHRVIVALCLVAGVLATIASLTQRSDGDVANPFTVPIDGYQEILAPAYSALSALALLLALVTCVLVALRAVRAGRGAAPGIWWLVVGHGFLTISYIAMATPAEAQPPTWLVAFALIAPVAGQVTYPAAILVVVLGQRLWGVELVVNRVILWAMLSASGVVLYLALVAVVTLVVPSERDALWVIAPVAIALAVQPLRRWLQQRIDSLVYGEGADPAELLSGLGDQLDGVQSGAEGLSAVCIGLRDSLRLGYVGLRRSEEDDVLIGIGVRGSGTISLPVRAGGEVLGDLLVSPLEGQRFDTRTTRLLDGVTGFVAAAWLLVDANRELETARAGVVTARAEERRTIRRDLHDGLGPSLAGSAFGLAAVENLLATDPAEAGRLLEEIAADVDRGARDVRALAEAMTQEPLAEEDPAEALTALGRRIATEHLDVSVEWRVPLMTPDRLKRTAHLIAAEALINAVRHADARVIGAVVDEQEQFLRVVVRDDGRGFDTKAMTGVGTSSMRERAESNGGRLQISSGPQGTEVVAWLPLTDSHVPTEMVGDCLDAGDGERTT